MKKIIGIILLAVLFGCGGGGGGGGGNPAPAHTPVIEDVEIYYWSDYYADYFATDELARGDDWYYNITIIDEGLDADIATWTLYPIGSDTPLDTDDMYLPSVSNPQAVFYRTDDDWTVQSWAPLGNYRIDFQVEDKAGNKSVVFTQFIKITW